MKASRTSECKSTIESHGKMASATDFLIMRVIRNRVTHLCGRVAFVPSFWGHRSTNLAARSRGRLLALRFPQVGRRLTLSTCSQFGVLPRSGACVAYWHPFAKTGRLKGWASWIWTPGYRWAPSSPPAPRLPRSCCAPSADSTTKSRRSTKTGRHAQEGRHQCRQSHKNLDTKITAARKEAKEGNDSLRESMEAAFGRIETRLTSLEQRTYDIKPGTSSQTG